MSDDQIQTVRDELEEAYLSFHSAGLRFLSRYLETEAWGPPPVRVPPPPTISLTSGGARRLPGSIHLWIVPVDSDEVVGEAYRQVYRRGEVLAVEHHTLRIFDQRRRRAGFGSELLAANETWYRNASINAITAAVEGDGSLFAARKGFDFDLNRPGRKDQLEGLDDCQLRLGAVSSLISPRQVVDRLLAGNVSRRESTRTFLARLDAAGGEARAATRAFLSRLLVLGAGVKGAVDGMSVAVPRSRLTGGAWAR
jgi:hypothetical protein